jgi:ubiquinone/menaquinone biosynthesis C-methylase UbiE
MTYYDEISEGYEELHKEEQEKKIKLVKQHIEINPEDRLLDVGCGTGLTTRPWKCRRFGIDPSERLLEKAKEQDKDGTYVLASAEKIPFEDNSFDIVISITAIQNFEDIEKGLNEIKRVGKNKFVLSFLKKSAKAEEIEKLINSIFHPSMKKEEDKDIIFFIG